LRRLQIFDRNGLEATGLERLDFVLPIKMTNSSVVESSSIFLGWYVSVQRLEAIVVVALAEQILSGTLNLVLTEAL